MPDSSVSSSILSNPLVPPVRSTQGCWSCRLRKKKCDETYPGCVRCESVGIECHYGSRPNWIDDKNLGKKELERVKLQVAASASRKRAAYRAKARSLSDSGKRMRSDVPELGRIDSNSSSTPGDTQVSEGSTRASSTVTGGEGGSALFSRGIVDQEANLIMHYLDQVFYIQYRFYPPTASPCGRGWLLSLLTRTKPLYHAALSLSAFHQQSVKAFEHDDADMDYLQELERQHNLTLQELQSFIQANSLMHSVHGAFDRNLQILACVCELISFELFNGGVSNWQLHLRAASELILILHEISVPGVPGSPLGLKGVKGSKPLAATALEFFTACIVWFDALSCISTGRESHLGQYHDRLLSNPALPTGPTISLETSAGCQNWVMMIINEIASLSVRKEEQGDAQIPRSFDFFGRAHDISFRLEMKRKEVLEMIDAIRQSCRGPPSYSETETFNKHTVLVVTNVFASAARIYLHTVTSTTVLSASSSFIQLAVQATVEALRMLPDPRMVRALVWPLCVAGCMASSAEDQEFFRYAAAGAISDSRQFGNSGTALEILETSWKLQKERGCLIDCASIIRELGKCVLLA